MGNGEWGFAEDRYFIAFYSALMVCFVTIPLFTRVSVNKPGFFWENLDILWLSLRETRFEENFTDSLVLT